MIKSEVIELLTTTGVWHEITEHPAAFNMAEMSETELPYPDSLAKNIFVRDDKKRNYYLITVRGDKKVDLKMFRQSHETRPLSFASAADLREILGLEPGSLTPIGLLNDAAHKVGLYLDQEFLNGPAVIGVHPNDNTATIWLKTDDLVDLIRQHGNEVQVVEIGTAGPPTAG